MFMSEELKAICPLPEADEGQMPGFGGEISFRKFWRRRTPGSPTNNINAHSGGVVY